MNWWQRIAALVQRPQPIQPGIAFGNGAGVLVTPDTALAYAAVWSCVRIITETVATLGWHIIRNVGETRERVAGGPVDWMLNVQANPEMTAFSWRELALLHVLLNGNHYSEIERDSVGRPLALWPLQPDAVQVERPPEGGGLVYRVNPGMGREYRLGPRNVLHVHGLGWDGLTGMSVIAVARRSLGAGLGMDEMGANFYKNGAHVGVALSHPGKLSDAAKDYLKSSFRDLYTGSDKAFKTIVLEEGMGLEKMSMSMVDAQFIESRKFQVSEICRWFRVPPHKVADLERATFSNIEHQAIEFVQDTILPWCRRLEQEVDVKLFGSGRQGTLQTRLNIDTLLRGDIASRYAAYEKGRNGGWLSANDVRKLENLNPIENGDIYLQPLNMGEAGEIPPPAPKTAAIEPAPDEPTPKETPDNVIVRDAKIFWNGKSENDRAGYSPIHGWPNDVGGSHG